MDDGFIFCPLKLYFENSKTYLNNMHSSIKFAFEKPEIIYENKKKVQVSNFLDVKIILHEDNTVETEPTNQLNYKPTNTHSYLPYDSAHPDHTTINILSTGLKESNSEKVIIRLDELQYKTIFKIM